MRLTRCRAFASTLIAASLNLMPTGPGFARADEKGDLRYYEDQLRFHQIETEGFKMGLESARIYVDDARRILDHLTSFAPADAPVQENGMKVLAAELDALDVRAVAGARRLILKDGRPSPFELRWLEISGHGPYSRISDLLVTMGARVPSRILKVETLTLNAHGGNAVKLTARLALPSWIEGAVPPPASPAPPSGRGTDLRPLPAGASDAVRNAFQRVVAVRDANETMRQALEALRAEESWVWGTHDLLKGFKMDQRNPRALVESLAAFARETRDARAVLTEVRLAGEVSIEGVVSGSTPRAALETACKKAELQVISMQISPAGGCQAFSIRARLREDTPSVTVPPPGQGLPVRKDPPPLQDTSVPEGLFDSRAAANCAPTPGR